MHYFDTEKIAPLLQENTELVAIFMATVKKVANSAKPG